jgi:hypothetical protein
MQRRNGIIVFTALSSMLLCGASSPSGCTNNSNSNNNIPGTSLSSGQAIAIAAGGVAVVVVGTVVLVEVHKSHHTLKGCVTAGPGGITVLNERDQRVYALTGITAGVKLGDIVKVNGNREKGQNDSAGDEDFTITHFSRDFGPCKAALAPPAGPPAPNPAP